MAVPVHIISGFLGTGKTTAIRQQLAARGGERVAVIVNDFGEAALDEATLSEAGPFRITNIAGACVCCTAPEGFVDALGAVLAENPERIFIEPTGLARPQDLVDTIRRGPHREALTLAPVIVLVDPSQLADAGTGGWREQVDAADVLVANRTDLCDAAALERFDALAAELWPAPLAVHRTQGGELPAAAFVWPEGARAARDAGQHAHSHDHSGDASTAGHVARSWQWGRDVVFARERVRAGLEALLAAGGLVRFKGIFHTREGVLRLEVAGGVLHEETSAFRRDSRADAIVDDAAAGLLGTAEQSLEAAILTSAELEAQAHQIEIAHADGRCDVVDRDALLALPDAVPDIGVLFAKRSGEAARVARLFERLEIDTGGHAVVCAADGFASEPVKLSALAQGLLLHTLEGEPLSPKGGGPFRLLIPGEVERCAVGLRQREGGDTHRDSQRLTMYHVVIHCPPCPNPTRPEDCDERRRRRHERHHRRKERVSCTLVCRTRSQRTSAALPTTFACRRRTWSATCSKRSSTWWSPSVTT